MNPGKKIEQILKQYRVDSGKGFHLSDYRPGDTGGFDADFKSDAQKLQQQQLEQLTELQAKLYAQDRRALLLIFQATDAAGKDGTIKHVMSGVNPEGCQVFSFKAPSAEELDHDYLWRTTCRLPQRGHIGIFNRSYYEEVLVVRVHPELLPKERIPEELVTSKIWKQRYEDIAAFERYIARNGIAVRKFFLHLSKAEQRARFLAASGRAGKELEVFRRRHPRAPVLGRLPGCLREYDSPHGGAACALVCRSRRP